MTNYSFLGAAIKQGQKKQGVDEGPAFMRKCGLKEIFKSVHFQDMGDISEKDWGDQVYFELYKKAIDVVKCQPSFCIFGGGDHSISLSTIPAIQKVFDKLCILWVDAHGDFNTPEISPSGSLHGMPLAALMGLFSLSEKDPKRFQWFSKFSPLPPKNIALLGIRALDKGEKELLKELPIFIGTLEDIKRKGMKEVLSEAFEHINPEGENVVHLSLDVDSVDPKLAPATGTPESGGLDLENIIQMSSYLSSYQRLVSMDFAEFNPHLVEHHKERQETYKVFEVFMKAFLNHKEKLS